MGLPTALESIYEPIRPELDRAHATVSAIWTDALKLVHGADMPNQQTGGKLLRPALCLLAAGAVGGEDDLGRFVDMAATFEMLHLAALVHDDVIDSAEIRRGAVSLNALWDDHSAVLGGDYLVSRATDLLTPYESCPLISNVVHAVLHMSEGELRSIGRGVKNASKEDCILLARQKTATLFASTCTGPTYLLGAAYHQPLEEYGLGFGIAFQLADDLLDLSQTEAKLGKPSCGDIAEGKATLPILFIREALAEADVARLDAITGHEVADPDRLWIAEALERTGARRRTEAIAHLHVQEAQTALDRLPPSVYRDSMQRLLEFILIRGF